MSTDPCREPDTWDAYADPAPDVVSRTLCEWRSSPGPPGVTQLKLSWFSGNDVVSSLVSGEEARLKKPDLQRFIAALQKAESELR